MSLPDSWIGRQDFKSISTFRSVSCVIRIYLHLVSMAECHKCLIKRQKKQNSGRRKNHKFKEKYPKFITETGIV